MLELLETKLSNIDCKFMYLFDDNGFLRQKLNNNIYSTIDASTVYESKSYVLSLEAYVLREMVMLYIRVQDKWINDFNFLLQVMKVAEYTFEEGLELFIGNNETQIVNFIASHDIFNISKQQTVELMSQNIKSGKLKSKLSYYLQHLDFTTEELKTESETIQFSLLEYKNIYKIKVEESLEFYILFKTNKLLNRCLEMLLDYGNNFNLTSELNLIEEFKDLVFSGNGSELQSSLNDIQEGYTKCLEYYEANNTPENQELMRYISIGLSNNIEDFSFLANEFINDEYFFMQVLSLAYPKAFELEHIEELGDKQVNYYMLFSNLEMNFVPCDTFSGWCNATLTNITNSKIHECLLVVIGNLAGKYFEKNTAILESINKDFVQKKEFQLSFVIAFSNTMGVVSSGINEIPNKYLFRQKLLVELIENLAQRNLYAHIDLATKLLEDLERTIKYEEERIRN